MENTTRIRHKVPLHHQHYYQLRPYKRQDAYDYLDGMDYRDGFGDAFYGNGRTRKGIEYDNGFAEGARCRRNLKMGR
jgi:hypothetical protein